MPSRFAVGDDVQTPYGKGVVREVRNKGQLLVQIQQRSVTVAESQITPLAPRKRRTGPPAYERPDEAPAVGSREVDLHGLHVEEALNRIDKELDAALRAGHAELRFIHGRSGGRLRTALHGRLRQIPTAKGFRVDPRNPGVTIVTF